MAEPKPKEYKLDMFRVLENLDRGNMDFYNSLTDDERKAFTARTVLRWASHVEGNNSPYFVMATNEFVNKDFWTISKHPELLWKLFALIGTNQSRPRQKQRHGWIPMPKKSVGGGGMIEKILQITYPLANDTERAMMRDMNSDEEFINHAKALAWSDGDIKVLKDELRKRNGKS